MSSLRSLDFRPLSTQLFPRRSVSGFPLFAVFSSICHETTRPSRETTRLHSCPVCFLVWWLMTYRATRIEGQIAPRRPRWKITDRFVPEVGLPKLVGLAALCSGSHRCSSTAGVGFREWTFRRVSCWYTGRICCSYKGQPPRVSLRFVKSRPYDFFWNTRIWSTCPHPTATDKCVAAFYPAKLHRPIAYIPENTQISSRRGKTSKPSIYVTKCTKSLSQLLLRWCLLMLIPSFIFPVVLPRVQVLFTVNSQVYEYMLITTHKIKTCHVACLFFPTHICKLTFQCQGICSTDTSNGLTIATSFFVHLVA